MDIQSEFLGFLLCFDVGNVRNSVSSEQIQVGTIREFKPSIEVVEYSSLKIYLEVLDGNPAELFLNELDCGEESFVITENRSIVVAEPKSFALPPGSYIIEIRQKGISYYVGIKIVPKNMNEDQLDEMRDFIERQMAGLSVDIFKSRQYGLEDKFSDINPAYQKYRVFSEFGGRLVRTCNEVIINPLSELHQQYCERYVSRKPDAKSLRWLCTPKGMAQAGDCIVPRIVYEKKAFSSVALKENLWLYSVIQDVRFEVMKLERLLSRDIDLVYSKVKMRESELGKEKKRLEILSEQPRFYYDKNCGPILREIEWRRNEIAQIWRNVQGLQEKLTKVKKWKNSIAELHAQVRENLPNKFLKTNTKVSLQVLKDPRYRFIYEFHKKLTHIAMNLRAGEKGRVVSSFKPTWQLYELYVLFQTIRVMQKLGFALEEGWVEENTNSFFVDLEKETVVRMENDNYSACVVYNQLLPKQASPDQPFYSEENARPDVKIDFYESQSRKHVNSLVVDAKYKRYISLFDENIDTDAVKQAKRYRHTIEYITPEQAEPKSVVSLVIFAYPRDPYYNKVVQWEDYDRIAFCQLSPDGESVFGLENFTSVIEKWISNKLKIVT